MTTASSNPAEKTANEANDTCIPSKIDGIEDSLHVRDAAAAVMPVLADEEAAVPAGHFASPSSPPTPLDVNAPPVSTSNSKTSPSKATVEQDTNKTIVEHRVITEPQRKPNNRSIASRFLGIGFSTPVVGGLLIYSFLATGAWAYLLPNYLALQETVKELETQVDRLQSAVTVLEGQVDRYEAENEKLEANLEEFEEQNNQLQLSNALYSKLTSRLNATIIDLKEQNEILVASNEEYERLNSELNNTAIALTDEVDALESAINDIGETALAAARINDQFLDESQVLDGLSGTLTEQVDTINGVIIDMNGEIGRLQDLVDELRTILTFLDEAADDIGESYDEISAFLANQIETNQNLLMETLQNTYQQTASNWVCSFQSFFSGDTFITNPDTPIGVPAYSDVMNYVEDNVLAPICLGRADFEEFLAADNGLTNPPIDVTLNQLISSLSEYTTAALNVYFPDEGETGLTYEDWEAARYKCSGLPGGSKFTMMTA